MDNPVYDRWRVGIYVFLIKFDPPARFSRGRKHTIDYLRVISTRQFDSRIGKVIERLKDLAVP